MGQKTRTASWGRRPGRRRIATRSVLVAALVVGILPLAAAPASAAPAATASVDRTISYRTQRYTYTFTVTNTSTADERVASVQITRPNNLDWTVTDCPQAPPGWTTVLTGTNHCTFNSAAGVSDDIPAGASRTFAVTGGPIAGRTSEEGVAWWSVATDATDAFNSADGSVAATGPGNALVANLYSIQLTEVVVETTSTPIGAPCPATNKKAPAGSSRVLTVCGRNYANTDFIAKGLNSAASGTFIANQGNFQGTAVPPGPDIVVLGRFPSVTVTSTEAAGLTVDAFIGNAPEKMISPIMPLTGYTTDLTPPPAPSTPDLATASDSGVSSTDDITNDNTPTFVGTAEPDSTLDILIGGTGIATTTTAADGTYSATVPPANALGDGAHTLTARATDPSANVGPESGTLTIRVDTGIPADPTIDARPGVIGSDATPTWAFSGEANGRFTCVLTHPNAARSTDNTCASPKTYDLGADSDGAYGFGVSQTDLAGNQSGQNTDGYVLDRIAPARPTINTRPAESTSDPAVSWTFSGEPGGTYECVLERPDGTQNVDSNCSSPKTFDLTTRPDGLYTFKVRQTDAAGHQSGYTTDTFTLDRQAPLAPTITAEPPIRSNDATPQWSWSGEAGGKYRCELVEPGGEQIGDTNCSAPKNYDLSSETDGLYTFRVRQVDDAGTAGPYASSLFTLDRQAPAAPSITGRPANITANENPQWSFSGEFGASYECVLVRPDSSEIDSMPCVSPEGFSLTTEADGDYTFKVRQIDAAGNPSPYASDDFTLDRQAPAAPAITALPPADSNDPLAEWVFNGESGAAFECVLVKPNSSELTDATCSSPKPYDLSGDEDGLYTFKVRQTDGAGHESAYAIDTFVLDRQAPDAPTIDSAPPLRANDATPQWDFTGEAGGTYECVIVKPGGAEVNDANCGAPKTYDLSSDADGLYTFKVRQIDAAGNIGPYELSSFSLDRQAPAAPKITARPANSTSNENPQWTFTGEFGASYACVLVRSNNSEIASAPCVSPKTFALAAEADGNYTFKVRQIDSAGNPGPYATDEFTLDRQAPAAPTITAQPPTDTNDDTPEWNFSGEPGGSYGCVLVKPGGAVLGDAACGGPKGYDLTGDSDGLYTFRVRQTDAAGNVGPYATSTFTLDRQAPVAPTITAAPPARTNDATQQWSFSGEASGSFECVLVKPGGAQLTDTSCSASKGYDLTGDGDGLYTFSVRQTDDAGNAGPYETSTFELDRQAPASPSITGRPANFTSNANPQWTFTGEFGASFECVLVRPDGPEANEAPCGSPKTFVLSAEPDGGYTFKVRQRDEAGNTGAYAIDTFTLDRATPAAPSIDTRPADIVNNPTVSWSFSGEPNAAYKCVLVKPDLSEVTDAACTSPKTMDLSGDADGSYTFKVSQTDRAGLTSTYATDAFTLDREAPVAPSITSAPPPQTNDDTPEWNFSGEPGGSFECVMTKPGGAQVTTSICSGPKGYDFTSEIDGLYTFRVRQIDDAGTPGPYATSSYTLDRVAPAAPVIGTQPNNATNDPDPLWTYTGEFGASYDCVLVRPDETEITESPCGSPTSFALSAEPDGAYTFKVRQTDLAGNTGPYVADGFFLDRVAPDPPSITSRPPTWTNNAIVQWTFVGDGSPPFECRLVRPDGTIVERQPCSPPDTWNLGAEADGTYTFQVRQLDDAGNKSVYTSDGFTLDRVAPVAPAITAQPPTRTNDDTPTWSFTGELGATFACVVVRPNNTEIQSAPCSSPKTFDLSGEQDGLYTFKVRQTDRAGNVSTYTTDDFTLDRQAPVAPAITSMPPARTNDETPTWSFAGEANGTYECVLTKPEGAQVTDTTCTSPKTFDVAVDADGLYTFEVRQTDVAGNTGPYVTVTYTLDRQAPVAPTITSQPLAQTNDDTPEWNFSGEAGGSYECVLTEPSGAKITEPSCAGPKGYDLSTAGDGLYTFQVRQTDVAGNTSPFVTVTFTLDREAPVAAAITGRPANVTPIEDPQWTFTGEFGASFECVLVRPDGSEVTAAPCGSPASFPLGGEPDGEYTFKVRQIDAAGNPGPWETDNFTLDRVPPGAPSIDDRPAEYVNDAAVEWAFGGENNATFECVLVTPDLNEVVDGSCVSPKTIDISGFDDGTYTFKVRQIDEAGLPGPYATDTFTFDRQAPAAPTITSQPPARTNDPTPDWTFSGEAGGSYECVLVRSDNTEIKAACSSPRTFWLTQEQDGDYTFKVRQTDDADNVGPFATATFTLDRAKPFAPSFTALPPNVTANTSPKWSFAGEPGATFDCLLVRSNGTRVVSDPCPSPKTFSMSGEQDGTYTFKVRQTDVAGNPSSYATDTFSLDRQAPTSLMITAEPPSFTNDTTLQWEFSGEGGGSYECVLVRPNGVQMSSPTCSAPKSYDLTAMSDGLYTFKVRQTDTAFNRGEYVTSTITLDRGAPDAPAITGQPADRTTDDTPEWTFTGEVGASYECTLLRPDDSQVSSGPCGSPETFDLAAEEDGTYTFKVRQIDAAGNPGPRVTDTFTLDRTAPPTPTITHEPPLDTSDAAARWEFTSGEAGGSFECVLVKPDNVSVTTADCSAPSDYDLASGSDGTYTFKVRQLDDLGNASGYATSSFNLDRVAPDAPTITSTPEKYYDTTPEWTFSGEAGGTYECVLVRPDASEIDDPACSSAKGFDLSNEADGNYTFKVRQIDAAGNVGAYGTHEHYFNKIPPTPVLDGGAPAVTNDPTHETTITGEPGAVFECKLEHPTESLTSVCTSPYSIDLSDRSDGAYTLSVRQFIGENASLAATQTFTLDRVVEKPALSVAPDVAGSDAAPTWSFDGEEGAHFECVLVHPDGSEVATEDCQDPQQPSLADRPDGDYVLKVRQTDLAGNVSGWAVRRYELDRVAPAAPIFTSTPKTRTHDLTPTWRFDGEDGATFSCALATPEGNVRKDEDCDNPKTFNLGRVEGKYRLTVTQTDRAGNEGPEVVSRMKLDVTKPVAKRLRVGPKRFVPTRRKTIAIRFRRSEPAAATILIKKGAKTLRTFKKRVAKTRVSLKWRTVYRKKVIKPGRYKVIVKLKDKAGNRSRVAVPLRARG